MMRDAVALIGTAIVLVTSPRRAVVGAPSDARSGDNGHRGAVFGQASSARSLTRRRWAAIVRLEVMGTSNVFGVEAEPAKPSVRRG